MNQVSIGGTEITEDADVVSVTGQFTITCVFDRILEEDGTPLTDEEMLKVGQDYISNENFRIGRDTNTDRYFLTDSPQLLSKDVAAKLLMDSFIAGWKDDLEQARKGSDPDSRNWEEVALQEIEGAEAVETYDEAMDFYIQYIYNWEPRPVELFETLIKLFVES